MAPGAVRLIDDLLTADMTMLEVGSGRSTVWYAARSKHVTSLEDNEGWAKSVQADLFQARLENVDLRVGNIEASIAALEAADVRFDAVVVDHGAVRAEIFRAMLPRTRFFIVMDDSDWPEHTVVLPEAEWSKHQHIGFRQQPLVATETTVWIRRDSAAGFESA